jgi:hypothetical protein
MPEEGHIYTQYTTAAASDSLLRHCCGLPLIAAAGLAAARIRAAWLDLCHHMHHELQDN